MDIKILNPIIPQSGQLKRGRLLAYLTPVKALIYKEPPNPRYVGIAIAALNRRVMHADSRQPN